MGHSQIAVKDRRLNLRGTVQYAHNILFRLILRGSSCLKLLHGQTNLIGPTDTLTSHSVEVIVPEWNQLLTVGTLDGICKQYIHNNEDLANYIFILLIRCSVNYLHTVQNTRWQCIGVIPGDFPPSDDVTFFLTCSVTVFFVTSMYLAFPLPQLMCSSPISSAIWNQMSELHTEAREFQAVVMEHRRKCTYSIRRDQTEKTYMM